MAGAWQAEYHAWVCPPQLGDEFAWQALSAVGRAYRSAVTFQYLPPGTPTRWARGRDAARRTLLRALPRPLLRFGAGEEIKASLAKGSNKSRLKRLEKIGRVEFKRVTDAAGLETVFDDIVHCYDARQASVHGAPPFRNDPLKRAFHLAMMREPGLLHATVLTVGGRVAAAHLGACGEREVQLGLIAHNPLFAKHSPGKFLILFLSRMLMQEGYEQLDLTPGDDSYKGRFANARDEVHTLTVYPSVRRRAVAAVCRSADDAARRTLLRFGTTPRQARVQAAELVRVRPTDVLRAAVRSARSWTGELRETRLYIHAGPHLGTNAAGSAVPISRDSLEDLLAYEPVAGGPSRRAFLSAALARIEEGQHVYTYAEGGRLRHYGWLAEEPTDELTARTLRGLPTPAKTALVHDLYTFAGARGRGLATAAVTAMLRDVARTSKAVAAAVPASNGPARRVMEKLGLDHRLTLCEGVRIDRARRWLRAAEEGPGGPDAAVRQCFQRISALCLRPAQVPTSPATAAVGPGTAAPAQ